MNSLRARLAVIWVLSLAAAGAVGLLLVQLYQVSATAQLARADTALAQGCERIADRYTYYVSGWAAPAQAASEPSFRSAMQTVVTFALSDSPGVAGGVWQEEAGLFAYADPTMPGRTELPDGTRSAVAALARAASLSGAPETAHASAAAQTLALRACPLRGPVIGMVGWTMTRVAESAGWDTLRLGLGVLLALVLALTAALTWLVLAWTRHIARIAAALATAEDGDLPRVPPTGEAELDRIVAALNLAGARLAEARRRGAELSARVAAAERLAALGRVAAGVAHEIRNPIAAMRLKAENALAGDPARRGAALEAVLVQAARLDRLSGELLAMTQRREARPEPVALGDFLRALAAEHAGTLAVAAPDAVVPLDPALLRRTLDSLLDNARRHGAPPVRLDARADATGVRLTVTDSGPGVPPDLRQNLFEPFVTGRADGTGLGLAIARELAEAMGGRLSLADPGGSGHGAVFALDLPLTEPPCRPC